MFGVFTCTTESTLLVCSKKDSLSESLKPDPARKPSITPIPKSQGKLFSIFYFFLEVLIYVSTYLEISGFYILLDASISAEVCKHIQLFKESETDSM